MQTPIVDFVRQYVQQQALRMHMPGHKGKPLLGPEPYDITEIDGADCLHDACGIIGQSEEQASRLFGCRTVYSTEGSSQCIRAMVYLALQYARLQGKRPVIAAFRNAHKTFLSAAALLDAEVIWLTSDEAGSYLSCRPSPAQVERVLQQEQPAAVYVTSPDYLGQLCDCAALAELCHSYGALLLVDNAHGAYLRFLPQSLHPMDLGADISCDSAHKTMPVLTGGAYLHLSDRLPEKLTQQGRNAMMLFGSTSPSYLVLQSLDLNNAYLLEYNRKLAAFLPRLERLKERLVSHGYTLLEEEPLKLTIDTGAYGYDGRDFAALLQGQGIVCEFADCDYLVLMLTPELEEADLQRLEQALLAVEKKAEPDTAPPEFRLPEKAMSIRQAAMSVCETIPVEQSVGRVLAAASVGCPPAVPIVACGEIIDEDALRCFRYYGIDAVTVVAE